MIASRPMSIAAAAATVATVMSVAMTRPAHGAGVAPSDRRAAMEIVTPGRNAAAGDALRHAHKYERPLAAASFSSFRPKRSEEPEPRVLAGSLDSRFRGNDD
jgi:hypothetical protein